MRHVIDDPWLSVLVWSAVKGLLVLAAAGLVCALLRRRSAATRHLVWSLAIASLLVMPILSAGLPMYALPVLPSEWAAIRGAGPPGEVTTAGSRRADKERAAGAGSSENEPRAPNARRVQGDHGHRGNSVWVLGIWLLGTASILLPLLVGSLIAWRRRRAARSITSGPWTELLAELRQRMDLRKRPRLLLSDQASMPVTTGLLRPAIVLPIGAGDWSEPQRRVVLLHELAHVKRRDCLTQLIAQLALAAYWFNPVAWLAVRRLRIERERACDDLVLLAGSKASDYADHLLQMVRSLRSPRCLSLAAVSMARKSRFESRLLAILEEGGSRRPLTLRVAAVGLLAVAAAVTPLAAIELVAKPRSWPAILTETFDAYSTDPPPGPQRQVVPSWVEFYHGPGGKPRVYSRREANGLGVAIKVSDSVWYGQAGKSLHFLDSNLRIAAQLCRTFPSGPATSVVLEYYMRTHDRQGIGVGVLLDGYVVIDHTVVFTAGHIAVIANTGWIKRDLLSYREKTWYYVRRELDCERKMGTFYVEELLDGRKVGDPSNRSASYTDVGSSLRNRHIFGIRIEGSIGDKSDCYLDNIRIRAVPTSRSGGGKNE